MLPHAHEIPLKTLFMKTNQSLITLLHKYFDVAMLIPEVSNSLQHQLDSKLRLASSVFPVLSTTLKKKPKALLARFARWSLGMEDQAAAPHRSWGSGAKQGARSRWAGEERVGGGITRES